MNQIHWILILLSLLHVHNDGKDKIAIHQQEVRACGKEVLAEFTQLGVGLASKWKTSLPWYPVPFYHFVGTENSNFWCYSWISCKIKLLGQCFWKSIKKHPFIYFEKPKYYWTEFCISYGKPLHERFAKVLGAWVFFCRCTASIVFLCYCGCHCSGLCHHFSRYV